MKKENMNSYETTLEYIKRFQTNQDKQAFNHLLEKYFFPTCRYASKYLSSNVYSNLISWSFQEVESYVFIAFWKAVNNYKSESESSLSFKNYLYQLVKFETLHELKKNFNWQLISNAHKKWYLEDEKNLAKDSKDTYCELSFREKTTIVGNFLRSKNEKYALIWELKSLGLKNVEVCKRLNISSSELKSRWQYIKKLILDRYPSLNEIV